MPHKLIFNGAARALLGKNTYEEPVTPIDHCHICNEKKKPLFSVLDKDRKEIFVCRGCKSKVKEDTK